MRYVAMLVLAAILSIPALVADARDGRDLLSKNYSFSAAVDRQVGLNIADYEHRVRKGTIRRRDTTLPNNTFNYHTNIEKQLYNSSQAIANANFLEVTCDGNAVCNPVQKNDQDADKNYIGSQANHNEGTADDQEINISGGGKKNAY